MWLTIVIAIASGTGLAVIVFVLGRFFNRALRSRSVPYQTTSSEDSGAIYEPQTRTHRGIPRKWATMLIIIAGLVALLVFVVIPAMKSPSLDNGAWQTRAVTPVTFIGEGVTQSTDSNGQWSSKCYIYDIGNSWRVASQAPLNIGQTYNIRGQVQILTDGTTWFIEEARR